MSTTPPLSESERLIDETKFEDEGNNNDIESANDANSNRDQETSEEGVNVPTAPLLAEDTSSDPPLSESERLTDERNNQDIESANDANSTRNQETSEEDVNVSTAPLLGEDTSSEKSQDETNVMKENIIHSTDQEEKSQQESLEEDDVITEMRKKENTFQKSYRLLEDVFVCPITNEIMNDPVIDPQGNSYERKAIENWVAEHGTSQVTGTQLSVDQLYPNRALKSIIIHEKMRNDKSMEGAIRRADETIRNGWNTLVAMSPVGSNDLLRPLPDSFYCSITQEIMVNPVIDPEGNSYEREAIRKWIVSNGMSPITRSPLTEDQLYENNALRSLIGYEMRRSVRFQHPSVRRFHESDTYSPGPADVSPSAPLLEVSPNRTSNGRPEGCSRKELCLCALSIPICILLLLLLPEYAIWIVLVGCCLFASEEAENETSH